jgi:hypothetical protein
MYIALKSDATYDVTAREHMGVWVEESGTWSKTGAKITFSPKKSDAVPYTVEEVNYKGRTFLTIEGEGGPSIPISTRETKDALDKDSKYVPMYVFFEIYKQQFVQETKQTYPFHTRPKLKQ